jgi:hypothetical protein
MPGSLTTLGNRCAPVVMFLDLILRVAVYDTVTLTYLRSVGSRNVGTETKKYLYLLLQVKYILLTKARYQIE